MRVRIEKESNYKGIFLNCGTTIRLKIDKAKPMKELIYPEFYDVDIFGVGQGLCNGGCSYCYLSATKNGTYVKNASDKIREYFGPMSLNQRPFQTAMPGSGEISLHPEFDEIFKTFRELEIVPNYTTNGMWVNDSELSKKFLESTLKYVGGVAVSCHKHLEKYWKEAVKIYSSYSKLYLNLHIIISDKESVDYFKEIYEEFKDVVGSFILLPYGNSGRAVPKEIEWDYLIKSLPNNCSKLGFGANFYDKLLEGTSKIRPSLKLPISLYPPESMSKFLDLKDFKIYKSSFDV